MTSFTLNDQLPDLTVATTQQAELPLSSLQGKNVVLYFYPKDNTPGCTQEGQDFAALYEQFQALNTEILGVSKDSLKKHSNFIEKYNFPFDLIADENETLCQALDVIKEKNMYVRKYMGIERSTFVFDSKGILRAEFRKVRVKGHVDAVLEAVQQL